MPAWAFMAGVATAAVSFAIPPGTEGEECEGRIPPLFVTDVELDTIFKARDFGGDGLYMENDGPVPDLHVFYDANDALALVPLDFPSCITASEDDYLFIGDSGLDIVVAMEDLNDDNDCYDTVDGIDETVVYFDGSSGATFGGNAAGITTESPNGVTTRALGVVWVASSNTSAAGKDLILRLEDMDGDLNANSLATEAVEYYEPAAGHADIAHSIPSALALSADELVHYVENGTGITKGVYRLEDTNSSGVIEDNPSEVFPFFLPTSADLIAEGVTSPVTMDLTSLESIVHEEHKDDGVELEEEWLLTDLANDVIWFMADADGNGIIEYSAGEASVYWHATVTSPSAVRDIAIDECEQLMAAQPEAPSNRIHMMIDSNGNGEIQDGTSEITDVYDELSAPVDMDTPYAIGGDFHLHAEVGTSFCQGTAQACAPCSNPGDLGQGCENSTGRGAIVEGEGTASVVLDDLGFHCRNLPDNQAALLYSGTMALNGGDGVPFGRGLRCVGGGIKRLELQTATGGEAEFGPGLGQRGDWASGETRYFQVWYRDPMDDNPCGAGPFNLSNGIQVTFTP